MKIVAFFIMLYSMIVPNKKRFEESYFKKNINYEYNALYIDSIGDTITNEKLTLKPTGKAWFAQKNHQEAFYWIYHSDSADIKRIKPFDSIKFRISKKEKTGGFNTPEEFYMHPPRSNQYRILFYSFHPNVDKTKLTDTVTYDKSELGFFGGGGKLIHNHKITPIDSFIEINSEPVKVWKIEVESTHVNQTNDMKDLKLNSELKALYCEEYGFLKLHHTFENGIKINFDLQEVIIK